MCPLEEINKVPCSITFYRKKYRLFFILFLAGGIIASIIIFIGFYRSLFLLLFFILFFSISPFILRKKIIKLFSFEGFIWTANNTIYLELFNPKTFDNFYQEILLKNILSYNLFKDVNGFTGGVVSTFYLKDGTKKVLEFNNVEGRNPIESVYPFLFKSIYEYNEQIDSPEEKIKPYLSFLTTKKAGLILKIMPIVWLAICIYTLVDRGHKFLSFPFASGSILLSLWSQRKYEMSKKN